MASGSEHLALDFRGAGGLVCERGRRLLIAGLCPVARDSAFDNRSYAWGERVFREAIGLQG